METSKAIKNSQHLITSAGTVINKKGEPVAIKDGKVRIKIDGTRKTVDVAALSKEYFPKDKPAKAPKAEEAPKASKEKPAKVPKSAKEASNPSGAQLVRAAYDKDPKGFNVDSFAETSGISKSRIKGAIKQHLERLSKKTAKK